MAAYKRHAEGRQRGAALLIMVMLLGLGGAMVLMSALSGPAAERQRALRTVDALAQASEALVGFAAVHGRLPRPAISSTDGNETGQPCDTEESCTGYLPWVTLGVGGVDAWGHLLRYSVTPAYSKAPLLRISAIATKTVQTRDSHGLLYYQAGQDVCDAGAQCLPAVVLSHGKQNFGRDATGLAQPNQGQGNIDEQRNAASARQFISRVASADPAQAGGDFDDQLTTISLAILYKRMGAAGTLP